VSVGLSFVFDAPLLFISGVTVKKKMSMQKLPQGDGYIPGYGCEVGAYMKCMGYILTYIHAHTYKGSSLGCKASREITIASRLYKKHQQEENKKRGKWRIFLYKL